MFVAIRRTMNYSDRRIVMGIAAKRPSKAGSIRRPKRILPGKLRQFLDQAFIECRVAPCADEFRNGERHIHGQEAARMEPGSAADRNETAHAKARDGEQDKRKRNPAATNTNAHSGVGGAKKRSTIGKSPRESGAVARRTQSFECFDCKLPLHSTRSRTFPSRLKVSTEAVFCISTLNRQRSLLRLEVWVGRDQEPDV